MRHPIERKRRRSAEQIRQLVERFQNSGLPRVEFAAKEGICLATLVRYLKIQSGGGRPRPLASPRFLEVERGGAMLTGGREVYRICLPGGIQLEVPPGYLKEDVAGLLSLIGAKEAW